MDQHITFLLHRTVWLMDSVADGILKRHFSISYRRFYFLLKVSLLPSCTQRALAKQLGYSSPAVSRMVDQLQKEGLLVVSKSPHHALSHCLNLTQEGELLVQKAGSMLIRTFDHMMHDACVDIETYRHTTTQIQHILEACQASNEKEEKNVCATW